MLHAANWHKCPRKQSIVWVTKSKVKGQGHTTRLTVDLETSWNHHSRSPRSLFLLRILLCPRPGALSGDRRPSSICLMSRTSALTRKPKGLGRRNFAQGYYRSHATPTPTSRSKGQKSRSRAGTHCGGHLSAQLVLYASDNLGYH